MSGIGYIAGAGMFSLIICGSDLCYYFSANDIEEKKKFYEGSLLFLKSAVSAFVLSRFYEYRPGLLGSDLKALGQWITPFHFNTYGYFSLMTTGFHFFDYFRTTDETVRNQYFKEGLKCASVAAASFGLGYLSS